MAEHATYFRYKVLPGKRQAVMDLFDKWEREQKPKAKGFIRSIIVASNDDPDELTSVARFDSTENYTANSNRPEQGAWFRELRSNLAADPEWFNGTVIRETSA